MPPHHFSGLPQVHRLLSNWEGYTSEADAPAGELGGSGGMLPSDFVLKLEARFLAF